MRDALIALIEALTAQILAGEIRMPTQIYNQLRDGIEFGFGELFDQCLQEQMSLADRQFAAEPKESIGQAKLQRRQRALKSIKTEWDRYEADNQGQAAIAQAVRGLLDCETDELLETLLGLIDPNRAQPLTPSQILAIARGLGWRPEGRSVQASLPTTDPQGFGFGGGVAMSKSAGSGGSGFGFGLAAEPPSKPVQAEPIEPEGIEPEPIAPEEPAVEEPDLEPIVPNTVPSSIVPSSLQVARGLARAMNAWQDLESNLLAWLYEGSQPGFGPSVFGLSRGWRHGPNPGGGGPSAMDGAGGVGPANAAGPRDLV
jgi:hypothetical protein